VKQIRVLIAGDDALIRIGVRACLERASYIRIVAEANDGEQALKLIGQHQPDVVLIDITRSELDGFQVTERITKEFPSVRVIIVSVHVDEKYVRRALRSGAIGYLGKSVNPEELEVAIKAAADGKTYLNLPLATVERLRREIEAPSLDLLTPRQREVLRFIVEGHSTKAIALSLKISFKTVESHRKQLMDRLGIHDTAGLVRYAIKAGIIRLEA
jgi:DNA-binding NarL/FixJ family response regulator